MHIPKKDDINYKILLVKTYSSEPFEMKKESYDRTLLKRTLFNY